MQAALVRKRIHNPAEQHSDANKKDERFDAVMNPLPRCVPAQNSKHDRDEKCKKRHGWKMMDDHFKPAVGDKRQAKKMRSCLPCPHLLPLVTAFQGLRSNAMSYASRIASTFSIPAEIR